MVNIFVGGLIEGFNHPKRKSPDDKPFFDLRGCHDIILVDRKFFLENVGFINRWALSVEGELGQIQTTKLATA